MVGAENECKYNNFIMNDLCEENKTKIPGN